MAQKKTAELSSSGSLDTKSQRDELLNMYPDDLSAAATKAFALLMALDREKRGGQKRRAEGTFVRDFFSLLYEGKCRHSSVGRAADL